MFRIDLGQVVSRGVACAWLGSSLGCVLMLGCSTSASPPSTLEPIAQAPSRETLADAGPDRGDAQAATPATVSASPGLAVPAAGSYRGTYFVPVPDELADYALFEIEEIRIRTDGDEVLLRYDLPALLLGDARGVSFRGRPDTAGSTYTLDGDDGRATCSSVDGVWTCKEVLRAFELDPDKLTQTLAALPESEAQARRAVSERFADDPIGILRLGMPSP